MKKEIAEQRLADTDLGGNGARALLAKIVGSERLKDYNLLLGQFQVPTAQMADENPIWTVIAVHKTAGLELDGSGRPRSNGGARCLIGDEGLSFCTNAGDAHQDDRGMWVWDTD